MNSQLPDLQHATISQLQDGLSKGLFTSLDLVKAYTARTVEINSELHAIISISPAAFAAAKELDAERKAGRVRSILHGIPLALKDTIATRAEDGMGTTAGSFALQGAIVPGDATCVARLREAGAIILCKTNLSTFGNFRGVGSGAWSPVGGQCTAPYFPRANPYGSSSGSAVAVAAGLATVAIGGETGGSIISPAARCALVGIRPTVGLVPGDGGVPIASSRDSFGPMTRTVLEGANVLEIMSGRIGAYTERLSARLDGVTLILPTNLQPPYPTHWGVASSTQGHRELLVDACQRLRELGAVVIEIEVSDEFVCVNQNDEARDCCTEIEFVQEIAKYLGSLKHVPSGVRDLEDLVHFIKEDPRESPQFYDTCTTFESALARPGLNSDQYREAKKTQDRAKGLIDAELRKYSAEAYILLSATTEIWGDAGWPQVTVPMGFLGPETEITCASLTDKHGFKAEVPMKLLKTHPNQYARFTILRLRSAADPNISRACGISFAGSGFSEKMLIQIAHAFEQATKARTQGKTYPEATAKTQLVDVMSPSM